MHRSFKHITPRYIFDRFLVTVDEHRNPSRPWLTRSMVQLLTTLLRTTDVGCEFGSGRSTLWTASRVAHLTSVEHDPAWHGKISAQLSRNHIANVLYLLREREHDYVAVTDQIADNSLDFALVDGMGRDKCALRLRQKLKPGGFLILDNANWFLPCSTKSPASINIKSSAATDDWMRFNESVAEWRSIWTTNGVWDTALWIKPS